MKITRLRKMFSLVMVATLSLWFASAWSVDAATTNVNVGFSGLHFSPTNVLINAGDTVIWTWVGPNHSTTSGTNGVSGDDNGVPSGLWDSGVNSTGHTFTNTFPSAGIFSYYCSVHFSEGMTGQVLVAAAPLPPGIALTNPLAGEVFAAPANVLIQTSVTNGSGTVTNVQFLAGAATLANVTSSPFSFTDNNLGAGNYTFTTIALANNGLSATNAVNISVVTPATVMLTNVFKLSGTNFQFKYFANTGLDYTVLRSTNLSVWIPIATNVAASNPVVFTDIHATNNLNFYRVGRLPNP